MPCSHSQLSPAGSVSIWSVSHGVRSAGQSKRYSCLLYPEKQRQATTKTPHYYYSVNQDYNHSIMTTVIWLNLAGNSGQVDRLTGAHTHTHTLALPNTGNKSCAQIELKLDKHSGAELSNLRFGSIKQFPSHCKLLWSARVVSQLQYVPLKWSIAHFKAHHFHFILTASPFYFSLILSPTRETTLLLSQCMSKPHQTTY